MKIVSAILGALLGLAFIVFGVNFFFNFLPPLPPPEEGSYAALFWGAVGPSGYMAMVKGFEIAGGLLTAIPKTRPLGLIFLCPILVNILAYHFFFETGQLLNPVHLGLPLMAAVLLVLDSKRFAGLFR